MRILALLAIFALLLTSVLVLWQYRFERSHEFPVVRLAEIQSVSETIKGVDWEEEGGNSKIRIEVDEHHPRVVARFALPGIPPVRFLHVKYQISASGLQPGKETWDDGRLMIDWISPQTGCESEYLASTRGSQTGKVGACVMRPREGAAVPTLRIEHLGASGILELHTFEATVLVERQIWKMGRWFLLAAWLIWIAAFVGPVGRTRWVRPMLAASVMMGMVLYFVVPGPWKTLRPLVSPFEIGLETVASNAIRAHSGASVSQVQVSGEPLKSAGKLPEGGDLTLRIKRYLSYARPLLHSLMMFGPTLVISFLIGVRRSVPLMLLLSVMIEAAQSAFGYGFDWVDAFDLLSNGLGIALGVAAHAKLRKIQRVFTMK